jgi:hypothetical protein
VGLYMLEITPSPYCYIQVIFFEVFEVTVCYEVFILSAYMFMTCLLVNYSHNLYTIYEFVPVFILLLTL